MSKKTSKAITASDVDHIAHLAKIPVTDEEKNKLAQEFNTTIAVVDKLSELDTNNTEPTDHVTGQTNVTREDTVDEKRILSQKSALANAKHTHKGYFVVDAVLER